MCRCEPWWFTSPLASSSIRTHSYDLNRKLPYGAAGWNICENLWAKTYNCNFFIHMRLFIYWGFYRSKRSRYLFCFGVYLDSLNMEKFTWIPWLWRSLPGSLDYGGVDLDPLTMVECTWIPWLWLSGPGFLQYGEVYLDPLTMSECTWIPWLWRSAEGSSCPDLHCQDRLLGIDWKIKKWWKGINWEMIGW